MIIALCINTPELDAGGYRDKEICKKYPGSGWTPHFCELAEKAGHQVMSGSELAKTDYDIRPLIFQEELNPFAQEFIKEGAIPWIITCFESYLYSPAFYEEAAKNQFPHKIKLFFSGGTHHLTFPSFEESEFDVIYEDWEKRKTQPVMIASNKMVNALGHLNLQPARYRAIEELGADVFGKGWPNYPEIEDKLAKLREYQYAVCFENLVWPGYITEKIIHCFIAGTIPLYLGAPDLYSYIPPQCPFSPETAREWLRTEEGRKYGHRGFAEWMVSLLP